MRLQRIIDDYRSGAITEETMQKYMDFMTYEEDRKYYNVSKKLVKRGVDEDDDGERRESIRSLVSSLNTLIGDGEMMILEMWVLLGLSQRDIAKELGTYAKNIQRIIQGIQRTCQEHYTSSTMLPLLHRAITNVPRAKRSDAHAPKHLIRYPSDFLAAVNVKGKTVNGRYYPKTECRLPEFFLECFGDGETTCGKCVDDQGKSKCTKLETIERLRNEHSYVAKGNIEKRP